MRRVRSPIGSAAEAQTPPASAPPSRSELGASCPLFRRPLPLFQRSLARSREWARLEQNYPPAAAVETDATISTPVPAKQDHPARTGPDPDPWARTQEPGALLPGAERLARRLHELLLSVEVEDPLHGGRGPTFWRS